MQIFRIKINKIKFEFIHVPRVSCLLSSHFTFLFKIQAQTITLWANALNYFHPDISAYLLGDLVYSLISCLIFLSSFHTIFKLLVFTMHIILNFYLSLFNSSSSHSNYLLHFFSFFLNMRSSNSAFSNQYKCKWFKNKNSHYFACLLQENLMSQYFK